MANLVRTDIGPYNSGSGASFGTGAFTTSSFTPPDNCLLVVIIDEIPTTDDATSGTAITIDDVGANLTWTTQVQSGRMPTWSGGSAIFTAPVSVGVSMQIVADAGAVNVEAYNVEVYAFTNYNTTTPVGATGAGTDADGDAAATINLSAAPQLRSHNLGHAFLVLGSDTNTSVTPGTGWDEIREVDLSPRFMWSQTQTRNAYVETAVAWADLDTQGAAATGAVLVAIEIRAETEPVVATATPLHLDSDVGSDGFVIPTLLDVDGWY